MSSPTDSVSISEPAGNPEAHVSPSNPTSDAKARDPTNQHSGIEAKLGRSFRRRWRTATKEEWAQPVARRPYHAYVHQLVEAGWENLRDLDNYMSAEQEPGPKPVIISVLDISDNSQLKEWPVLSTEHELSSFITDRSREGVKVRLYMAEYNGRPRASTIETFGSCFKLDPRFFKLAINSPGHVFTPAQRHRAPFVSIGFGVLDETAGSRTDAKKFKVLVYIQPDDQGSGWTGIIFFSSHAKLDRSPRIVTDPPVFQSKLPPPTHIQARSFRELYIESLLFNDPTKMVASPFFAISNLLLLDSYCWNEIIVRIREEDHRLNGISDTSVSHTEEIQRSLGVVQRSGSLGWKGNDEPQAVNIRMRLEEDFKHLVDETDLLWKCRSKMAAIRQRSSESRWNTLTNAFTYLFAPITIMTGIYGMNVSQISGDDSNPNIWQFFVAVAVMNVVMVLTLAFSNWVTTILSRGRNAGLKEVFGFAMGNISTK